MWPYQEEVSRQAENTQGFKGIHGLFKLCVFTGARV